MTGPQLPDAEDVEQARRNWDAALEAVRPLAELQRLALESEQTDRAYVAGLRHDRPRLPSLTDCCEAAEAADEAAECGTDEDLERAVIALDQTERAHIAHMDRRMPEAE